MSEIERDEGETVEGRDTRVKQRENNFREPSANREEEARKLQYLRVSVRQTMTKLVV